jgi:hypothetical protein
MRALSFALCALMAGAIVAPVEAASRDLTGNGMGETCAATTRIDRTGRVDLADASYCLGFITAMLFVGEHLETESRFCPAREVSIQQATNVFLKYLNANPERTHYSAVSLAVEAFQQAWPCPR